MWQPLLTILSRWECSPPVIEADEADGALRGVFEPLLREGSLREQAKTATASCTECGEPCPISFIADSANTQHGYIHCRDCGISRVSDRQLARWEINTPRFLSAAFAGLRLAIQERIPGQLWQIGKATWAGRSREIWFLRAYRHKAFADVTAQLERRPKAIYFTPTEATAGRWQDRNRKSMMLALESALSFDGQRLLLDVDYIESRIVDAGWGAAPVPNRKRKKRGDRAANIEKLKIEVIEHLRRARDYAFAQKDLTGQPRLLQRPTQKKLGELAGLSESDVSRCMNDPEAAELRLYWETALDLNQIMAWKGPVSKGTKA